MGHEKIRLIPMCQLHCRLESLESTQQFSIHHRMLGNDSSLPVLEHHLCQSQP